MVRVSGASLFINAGRTVVSLDGGAVRSSEYNEGLVLYGPYQGAQPGIYHVALDAQAESVGGRGRFDIHDADTDYAIFADVEFGDGVSLYVRLYETSRLEFRFYSCGSAFSVRSIELTPVLLDDSLTTVERLLSIADRLAADGADAPCIFRLIDRLAELGAVEEAEQRRAGYVEQMAKTLVWEEQAEADRSSGGNFASFETMHSPEWASSTNDLSNLGFHDAAAVINSISYETLDIRQATLRMRERFSALSISPELIQATRFYRAYDEPPRKWRDASDRPTSGFTSRRPNPLFERYVDIDRSYQFDVASGRGMAAYCPVSGRLLRSRHGFLINHCHLPFIAYRFEGSVVFYTITGHISSAKLFIYIPRLSTIIFVGDPWFCNYSAEEVVRWLGVQLLMNQEATRFYLQNDTRPAAVLGNNIVGHYIWHTLTGLDWALRQGLAHKLAELIGVERRFNLEPDIIFPELSHIPFVPLSNDDEFVHCIEGGLVPVHLTDLNMDRTFVQRLREVAVLYAPAASRPPARLVRPLLWITLRSHNKVWVDQADGYINILNKLLRNFPRLSVFLDGTPDVEALAAYIRSGSLAGVDFYDGIGTPEERFNIYGTIAWALSVDAHIGPIGSGMVFTWQIANKPGVLHAEHAHLQQMDWLPGMCPPGVLPSVPDAASVNDLSGKLYGDYNIDWRLLHKLLLETMNKSFKTGVMIRLRLRLSRIISRVFSGRPGRGSPPAPRPGPAIGPG